MIMCVCSLTSHHAKRMCRIISSYMACPVLPLFSTVSHKWHDFRKKKVREHKICDFLSLQIFSKTFLILIKIPRDIIRSVHRSSSKVSVILVIVNGI